MQGRAAYLRYEEAKTNNAKQTTLLSSHFLRGRVQAALKEKLDTRAFVAGSRPNGAVSGGGAGAGGGGSGVGSFSPRSQFRAPHPGPAHAPASTSLLQPLSGYTPPPGPASQAAAGYSGSSALARAALEEQARTLFH